MTILNNCALLSGGHIELEAAQNALTTQLMIFEVCFKDNSQKAIFIDRVNYYLQTIWDKKVADKIAAECMTLRQENKCLQDENQQLKTRAVPTLSPSTVPVSSPLSPESDDEEKNNRRMRALQANEIKALHSELKKKDAEIEAKEAELSKLRVALDFKTRMLDSNTHELNLFRRQALANNQPINPASVAPVLPARKN
jgi:predicted RNase H-like nuclease (RuvC/YqgF family)